MIVCCYPYIRGQWGTSVSSRRKTSHGEDAPSVHPFADQQITNPINLPKWSNLPKGSYIIYMGFSTWSVCGVWELLIRACRRTGLEPVDVWSAILKPHWQVKIQCNINVLGCNRHSMGFEFWDHIFAAGHFFPERFGCSNLQSTVGLLENHGRRSS